VQTVKESLRCVEGKHLPLPKHITHHNSLQKMDTVCDLKAAMVKTECSYITTSSIHLHSMDRQHCCTSSRIWHSVIGKYWSLLRSFDLDRMDWVGGGSSPHLVKSHTDPVKNMSLSLSIGCNVLGALFITSSALNYTTHNRTDSPAWDNCTLAQCIFNWSM